MEPGISFRRIWAGRILSGLAVSFLLFDSIIKLLGITPVLESFGRLGYPVQMSVGIGILELACVAAYVARPLSLPGAVLLTGFLGGAVASHVRIGDPLFSHVLFPTYVGTLLWVGLFLRDDRLRTLLTRKGALR
ncbi:MAG TPA: DoxX family protein [Candidatus Eisenbacteria bacterium]|nr:DoxX family protein [Candidatus Eisenbacteria bacterium]